MNCVYISPPERIREMRAELNQIIFEKENFILARGHRQKSYWAQNVWIDAKIEKVESIKKAATFLQQIQRNWSHFPLEHVRRTKLIQETLPKVKAAPLVFPAPLPTSPLGAFALRADGEMIYAAKTSTQVPNGEFIFAPPAIEPPSAAYLKLWEALTRFGQFPRPGDSCVDIGSSPGSWTQALLAMGTRVFSVDRTPLEIPDSPKLKFVKGDAFKILPEEIENPQWVFSDVICFPDKLYDLALAWKEVHPRANFIFTIKFQSAWNPAVVEKFMQIPNSRVLHLFHNKHELCWMSGPA